MNYHIDTGLIIEAYSNEAECPLCYISDIVTSRILEQFATEAVMSDSARAKVNQKGICGRHFEQLFARPNKLGVALQAETRLKSLRKLLSVPKNPKQADALGKTIEQNMATCLLCELVDFNMDRYYKTFAQMFRKEPNFEQKIRQSKGICFFHYGKLLRHSGNAGPAASAYLQTLASTQDATLEKLQHELDGFVQMFDYRSAGVSQPASKDAHIRAINKIKGRTK